MYAFDSILLFLSAFNYISFIMDGRLTLRTGNVIFLDVHTAMRALQGMSKPLDEFNLQITKDSGLITANPEQLQPPAQLSPPDQLADPSSTTSNPLDQPAQSTDTTNTTNETNKTASSTTSVVATPEQITLYGWRKGKSVKGVPLLMRYATVEDVKSKDFKPSAYYKKLLAQLRSRKNNKAKNRQHGSRNREDRDRDRNHNRNRNRSRRDHLQDGNGNGGGDGGGRGKRKFTDGDIDMTDPVEQEKRLQRRKKFFPGESEEATNENNNNNNTNNNYIVSSTTVPALLQSVSTQPAPTAAAQASS